MLKDEERIAPLSAESLQKVKAWLSPTDSDTPASEYKKHLNSHAAGTGEWILETDQYCQWSQSKVGNLWIRGIPGCGKSVVAASFISRFRRINDGPVLFFFFREIIQANRSPRSLMQDFCHEMLEYSPWLQSQLSQLQTQHSSVESVPYEKLWKCMATAMGSIGKVHCVVDALDEMEQGNDQFFQDLLDLGRQSSGSIKLILTSRQVPHVEKHLKGTSLVDLRLDRRNVDRDIAVYITQRLRDAHLDLPQEKIQEVKQAICDRGQGLFLYSRLMLDQLLLHPESMLVNIKTLPDGLGDMYTELLRDHAARSGTSTAFQQFILQWITHSARPMRLLELAVMVDSLPDRGGLSEDQDAKLAIRTTCGPLLEICEDGVIQIIHHSLTEFALDRDVTHTQMSNNERIFSGFHAPTVHGMITRICINYLSNGCLDEIDTKPKRPSEDDEWSNREFALRFYFLRYAVVEWPLHASKAVEFDGELLPFLDEFCTDGTHSYEAWKVLWPFFDRHVPKRGTSLHNAAYCGIPAFVRYLIRKGVSPDSVDFNNTAPIESAVERNHAQVITLLLEHGAKPDMGRQKDLVLYATKLNHPKSLRALIDGGVELKTIPLGPHGSMERFESDILGNYVSYEGSRKLTTPFEFACHDGHVEAAQELMNHHDSSYLCDGFLHLASRAGKSQVVAVLLENEEIRLTINRRDLNGNTPLYLAAMQRDYETVKNLLEHGADINLRSMNLKYPREPPYNLEKDDQDKVWPSYSPLHGLATGNLPHVCNGPQRSTWIETLDLLLSSGCDIDATDHRGRTPLFYWPEFPTSNHGSESLDFVTTLLDRGANAALLDSQGSSPLYSTQLTSKIAEALVKGGADINSARNSDGMTPLMLMARCLDRIELSLWHDMKADFSQKSHNGNTAFHHSFRSRISNANKKDITPWIKTWCSFGDLHARNNAGRTPLLEFLFRQGNEFARQSHSIEILQEFVKNGAILEDRDLLGRTALLTTLNHQGFFCFSLVDEVLRLGGDAKAVDNEGGTGEQISNQYVCNISIKQTLALHYAFKADRDSFRMHPESSWSFIQKLIQSGASIHATNHVGNTILHELVGVSNCFEAWKALEPRAKGLANLGLSYHSTNCEGQTVLHLAASNKVGELKKKEERGQVLDFLLESSKGLDINARDNDGRTPLHFASSGSDIYAFILIQNGANIRAEDYKKRTPLHLAAEAGQSNIVGLILESYKKSQWSVNELCSSGRSPLHEACRAGCQESVQFLLDAGADPQIQNEDGQTPLHATAEFLCKKTANAKQDESVSIVSNDWDAVSQPQLPDQTFRDIRQVVALLISAGGDPSTIDSNGHTVSDVAATLGCFPVFEELQTMAQCDSKLSTTPYHSPLAFIRKQALTTRTPEAWTLLLKKIVSTGDARLVEDILRTNNLKISGPDGESLMSHIASWGLASMMGRMIPYVEDLASMGSRLLESATRQRSCNTQMVKVLVNELAAVEDESIFAASVNHLAQHEAWWYPRALSILLGAGADPNLGVHSPPLYICLNFGTSKDSRRRSEKWNIWGAQVLEILLHNGADPKELKIALEANRDVNILKMLVDHGADLSRGTDLLSVTLCPNDTDPEALEFLLESGVDPNGTDSTRPLFLAAGQYKCQRSVEILVKHGSDPHASMKNGQSSVLHEVCEKGGVVGPMLAMGIDINTLDAQGRTPLIRACMCREDWRTKVAELLQAGARLDLVDDANSTALHHAAHVGNERAVKELLNHGVDISPRNSAGGTPLCNVLEELAKWCGVSSPKYFAIIKALLDAGASPLEVHPDGRGALHFLAVPLMNASNEDREEEIHQYYGKDYFSLTSGLYQQFLEAGCDPELRDNKGRTPIFYFVDANKYQFGDFIDRGPSPFNPEDCQKMFAEHDIHKIDYNGETLLHAIARRDNGECDEWDHIEKLFSMLVELGLDPWKENNEGQTPLDFAAVHDRSEILALFARED